MCITANPYNSIGLSTSQARQGRPPTTPVALAWSIAQRANHDITIQASIEHVFLSSFLKVVTSSRSLGLDEAVSTVWMPNNDEYNPTSPFAH